MSEGGVYPWKRQNRRSTAPDYQRLLRPLPEPPAGLSWIHDATAPEKWILVAHTDVAAQEEQEEAQHVSCRLNSSPNSAADDDEWTTATTTATRVVPLETEGLLLPTTEPSSSPSAVFAQAAVHSTEVSSGDGNRNNNGADAVAATADDENQQEGVVMLPQARMVTAAAAVSATPVATATASSPPLINGKKNKENIPSEEEYTQHVVMPTDTLAGLCLMYKISRRELQRANRFYGNDLRLAPAVLYIPISEKARRTGFKPQDVNSPEFKMAAFMAQFPALSMVEAKCYLETNDWNLEPALQEAHDDAAWERQEAQRRQQLQAVAAADKVVDDPYANNDDDAEEDNDDCLPCFSFLISALRSLTKA